MGLVLTRSPGEELVIGQNEVIIEVLEIRGSQVRMKITADKDISIHRREIYERIVEQQGEVSSRELYT